MSDVREQLEKDLAHALVVELSRRDGNRPVEHQFTTTDNVAIWEAIWPLVESALAAARSEALSDAAQAIQRERDARSVTDPTDYGLGVALHTIFALREPVSQLSPEEPQNG